MTPRSPLQITLLGLPAHTTGGPAPTSTRPACNPAPPRHPHRTVRSEPPLWQHMREAGACHEELALLQDMTGARAGPCGGMVSYPHALGYLTCTGDAADEVLRRWLLEGWALDAAVEEVQRDLAVRHAYRIHFGGHGLLTTTSLHATEAHGGRPGHSAGGAATGSCSTAAPRSPSPQQGNRCSRTGDATASPDGEGGSGSDGCGDREAVAWRYGFEDYSWAQSVWNFFV